MNKKLIFIFFFLFSCSGLSYGVDLPKPTGWVADYAGVIDDSSSQQMSAIIQELEQKTGAEIAVVTVKNLGNDSIENFSVQLFKRWGIGKKGKDNGVLLAASIDDRKVKIEVGYGLEGILPDGLCGEILDTYVIPNFKEGAYSKGLTTGVLAIASVIAKDAGVELTGGTIGVKQGGKSSPLGIFFQFLFFIIIIYVFIRHPFLFLLFLGTSGGRGSGGGGFGGGFGGFGGGMSGGGGASRGW
ncbi:MAG: TPM domain-containing protein [Elusimicrobia bacterium]|nr:TPM domain-containing protein [Elusimicrobiota bacterium]